MTIFIQNSFKTKEIHEQEYPTKYMKQENLKEFLNFSFPSSFKKFQNDTANAAQVQQEVLRAILKIQKNTEYGTKYNFAAIKSIAEFQRVHPLSTYEDYRFIIENIANTGEFTKLVSEPIISFLETAGTTGKSKLIPETKRAELNSSAIKSVVRAVGEITDYYYHKNKAKTTDCRTLTLLNSRLPNVTPSGVIRGTRTSLRVRDTKFVKTALKYYTSPPSLFLISDYKKAYYCHLLFALLDPNLGCIVANFASNVLETIQILENNWSKLVSDIEYGRIDESIEIDESIREELLANLKPNAARAEALRTEFEKGFKGILPRIWPQLSYVKCVTTGSMQLYKQNLQFYADSIPFYSPAYVSSESWIGVNLDLRRDTPAYTIHPRMAFFEFIPVREIDANTPTTVDLTSLHVGECYEIVITTVAGLYRYRLGDIVKCVGYYNESPIVEFLYREGTLLNLNGEKVSEEIVLTALTKAVKLLGDDCRIVEYTTRVEFTSQPWKYVIYIEISKIFKALPNLKIFQEKVDEIIRNLNILYREDREENAIGFPEIKLVSCGTFSRLKHEIIVKENSDTQFKMPRLLKNSHQIDFVESCVI